jgi:hypothetical protein
MASLIAVEAHDRGTVARFTLLLWAGLGNVTHLVAVVALGDTTGNRLASVLKTLQVVFNRLRPPHILLRALWAGLEPNGNGEFLVQVSLKVHVGVGWSKLTLHGDEVQWDAHGAEALFEVDVCGFRAGLDILEECLLNIIHVAFTNSLNDGRPCSLSLDSFDLATVDLAWVLADGDSVA